MSIYSILDAIREVSTSERDKGDRFERLMLAYFRTEPTYKSQFNKVWLWNEWRGNGGRPDTGIDLVAENADGDGFTAIQCKMYAPTTTLDKKDIDSFFNESGKAPFTQRIIVTTTNQWTVHAENSLQGQDKPVIRIGIEALANSAIDWEACDPSSLDNLVVFPTKKRREHQKEAIANVIKGFKNGDRGKLIMACGTGKTFTAQCIAEDLVGVGGKVLVLVPSISLLSQTVKEWTADSNIPIHAYAVCSDSKAGRRRESEDAKIYDLALPATTDVKALVKKFKDNESNDRMSVILSTYQSIAVVAEAQKRGLGEFDLIIADEAHRTTGVKLIGEDDSNFTKVHDNNFINSRKRLYMTATPRMYGEVAKAKAAAVDATLASMDDQEIYGAEFHKLEFYDAVQRDLLTDYKVIVLAINEDAVAEAFQRQLADKNHELKLDEATRIVGCLNAFSKIDPSGRYFQNDSSPMRRVVAFSNTIANSKKFKELFSEVSNRFNSYTGLNSPLKVVVDHVDGSFNSLKREELLGWLKNEPADSFCSVLSNAKCLTEGVDVPALDGIVFLEPRNSIVDVVQAVGRVMRKSAGKKYGYVILPIGIPSGVTPEEALSDNKRYAAVWQTLNALRSHDKRIEAIVKKIDLNNEDPEMIEVIPVGFAEDGENIPGESQENEKPKALQLEFPLEEIRAAIYAKMVEKVGTRQYWENWAADVAQIAERHVKQINDLLIKSNSKVSKEFNRFLKALRENLNESISQEDAIEMLAQHLITKPVFDAIFGDYGFTERNPVSAVMQGMVEILSEKILDTDRKTLEGFYADVKSRVEGIDNLEGKQRIITELYEKFFRYAFPKTASKLGIVYTPIEIVDFIIHSVEHVLKSQFGTSLAKRDVQILDPFTGTGTFITRLLQSNLIPDKDLLHKYKNEIAANEIILLAYYIAAINIESVFHEKISSTYIPYEGIVLTDTFQMYEDDDKIDDEVFVSNNARLARQKKMPIKVVIGNPPYSVGQLDKNDNNQNVSYPTLDSRIRRTYNQNSQASLTKSLYDSYIRAFRWASDRIGEKGVIGFVSNGSFIDGKAMDGFRRSLAEEFSNIFVFNLRGNQRTQGESSKREGGKVFGSGSRNQIAITILVKNPTEKQNKIFYKDIGEYLPREEKLRKISEFASIAQIDWQEITPNVYHDWTNQRGEEYAKYTLIAERKKPSGDEVFAQFTSGVKSGRDIWVYQFSRETLEERTKASIEYFNMVTNEFRNLNKGKERNNKLLDELIENRTDLTKISWDVDLVDYIYTGKTLSYDARKIRPSLYRPFTKKYLYYDKVLNSRTGILDQVFPEDTSQNLLFSVNTNPLKPFGLIMTNLIPDLQLSGNGQCFPLYIYEKSDLNTLFEGEELKRRYAISDRTLQKYQKAYGDEVTHEDIFYYVYGLLHHRQYQNKYQNELGKSLPRIPMVSAFADISRIGRSLSDIHVNYEKGKLFNFANLPNIDEIKNTKVLKIRYPKNGKSLDKTRIICNDSFELTGIPQVAHDYQLYGRSALDWVLDRYQYIQDADSGIIQDPNMWSKENNYIIKLLSRVTSVSIETLDLLGKMPTLQDI